MQRFVHLATTRLWWVHVGTLSCISVHEVRLSSQCGADVIFVFAAGYTRVLLWTLCSALYWCYLHCQCWLEVEAAEFYCFLVKLMPVEKVVKKLCLLPHYKIQGNKVEFNYSGIVNSLSYDFSLGVQLQLVLAAGMLSSSWGNHSQWNVPFLPSSTWQLRKPYDTCTFVIFILSEIFSTADWGTCHGATLVLLRCGPVLWAWSQAFPSTSWGGRESSVGQLGISMLARKKIKLDFKGQLWHGQLIIKTVF